MSAFQALALGVIQGLTEFLPVSSSGHLILLPYIANWPLQDGAFDAIVHLGTVLAIIVYFSKDILEMLRLRANHLLKIVIVGTIPVIVLGTAVFMFDINFRSVGIVAFQLVAVAIVMLVADLYAKKNRTVNQDNGMEKVGIGKALAVGAAQAIAIIPGTSRSGITISASLFAGMPYKAAVRYAFLLGIPSILAAGAAGLLEVLDGSVELAWAPLLLGFLFSFISGYASISILLKFIQHKGLTYFAIYRILLAVVLLVLLWR